MLGDAGALPECELKILMTSDHTAFSCASLGTVEPESNGLPGRALTQNAMRRLQFIVNAAGWLHSMVLHGCSDAVDYYEYLWLSGYIVWYGCFVLIVVSLVRHSQASSLSIF